MLRKWKDFQPAIDEKVGPEARRGAGAGAGQLFLTTLWFGLLAGWLELGLVLAQRVINPHVPVDTLRTNRHFVWMIPVSNALIFSIVGLSLVLLARFRRGLAWQTAWRLSVGLTFLTMLLAIEGLHAIACVVLACGLASTIGPWLGRQAVGVGRLARVSVPLMVVGLIVLTGLNYDRVVSAERRALSLCPPAKPGAPNLLLIVLDNVRAASLSLYGYNRPTSPNLERLARKAVVFSEARSTAPWTLPSHASMLTGRWPHELSVGPDLPLDGTFPTLAEALGREGYATAGFVGNTGYCGAGLGLGRGFAHYEDDYENEDVSLFETVRSSGLGKRVIQVLGYPIRIADGVTAVRKTAAMLNRDVLSWLSKRPAGQPFFAFINYYDAHTPYVLQGTPDQRFGMAALPDDKWAEIEKRFLDYAKVKSDPAKLGSRWIVNDVLEMYRDSYESCIADLDRQVGLLLDEIDRRGSLDNTLVIVTSDHGEHLGEHGLLGHAQSLYRHEVHVPLLVIPPARASTARVIDEPVSIQEIPATVAEWVGLGTRNPFPGRSLTRFLGGDSEKLTETSPVLCEVQLIECNPKAAHIPSSLGPVSSLVTRDRVYIRIDGDREELYDVLNDPFESNDLGKDERSRPEIEKFRERLCRLRRSETSPAR